MPNSNWLSPGALIYFQAWLGFNAGVLVAAEKNNEAFLLEYSMGSSQNYHSYWIAPDLFPGKTTWNEVGEAFPIVLEAEVLRSTRWLTEQKRLTNTVELEGVRIKRTICGPGATVGGMHDLTLTIGWTVTFQFYERIQKPIPPEVHWVVMLLDGTYASERRSPKTWGARSADNSLVAFSALRAADSNTRHALRQTNQAQNPYELVRSADFRIPGVQWDPKSPFPMDLSAVVGRTKDDLVQHHGMPSTFSLQEVRFEPYWPDGAVPDVAELLQKHRWHWIVHCAFASRCSDLPSYEAYILLDGRTLSVRVPDTFVEPTNLTPESEPSAGGSAK